MRRRLPGSKQAKTHCSRPVGTPMPASTAPDGWPFAHPAPEAFMAKAAFPDILNFLERFGSAAGRQQVSALGLNL
jgi:hypothetical protein